MWRTRIFAPFLLLGLLAGTLRAALVEQSGDLGAVLRAITLPGARSEAFRTPGGEEIARWREALDALLAGNGAGAAGLADPLGYDVIAFSDTGSGAKYWLLQERAANARALGTYVVNPNACRLLSIQAPHAGGDLNTLPQGVAFFLGLNAHSLLIAGAHRCANTQVAGCGGTTSVCSADGSEQPYTISDPSHFTQTFFQATHEQIARRLPGSMAISLHGFTWQAGDPEAIVSNATCNNRAPSVATQVAEAYTRRFAEMGLAFTAGSCNAPGGPTRLCAETNVQGRFSAGAVDACACSGGGSTCAAGSNCPRTAEYPERFVHIEQSCAMREVGTCGRPGRFSYADGVGVLRDLFPCWPRIAAAVHGASFEREALAPGAFFTLYGSNLGADVTVEACGRAAALTYAGSGQQLNGILPEGTDAGRACRIAVRAGGVEAAGTGVVPVFDTAEVEVKAQALALFTHEGRAIVTDTLGLLHTAARPAARGSIVSLWATGGGVASPFAAEITIGGAAARVWYAGRAPGFPGLDQINVEIPAAAGAGAQPLVVNGRRYEIAIAP